MAKNQGLGLRLSQEDRRQLSELMSAWGETQSDAIRRCIAIAYNQFQLQKKQEADSKIELVNDGEK